MNGHTAAPKNTSPLAMHSGRGKRVQYKQEGALQLGVPTKSTCIISINYEAYTGDNPFIATKEDTLKPLRIKA
jgi:hypothetical protein